MCIAVWKYLSFLKCVSFSFHIADPFDLNHNLGAGLSRKSRMISVFFCLCLSCHFVSLLFSPHFSIFANAFSCLLTFSFVIKTVTNFIMKAFINGRTVFGTPVKAFPAVYPSHMVSVYCLNTKFAYCGGTI